MGHRAWNPACSRARQSISRTPTRVSSKIARNTAAPSSATASASAKPSSVWCSSSDSSSREAKNVVLFAPKAAREDVWEPPFEQYLPDLNSGFVRLRCVFNHTDLQREGRFAARSRAAPQRDADVVIIDEAHHFRNPGIAGEGDSDALALSPAVQDSSAPARARQSSYSSSPRRRSTIAFTTSATWSASFTASNERDFISKAPTTSASTARAAISSHLEKRCSSNRRIPRQQLDPFDHLSMPNDALKRNALRRTSSSSAAAPTSSKASSQGDGGATFPTREDPHVAAYKLKSDLWPAPRKRRNSLQQRPSRFSRSPSITRSLTPRPGTTRSIRPRNRPAEAGRRPHPHPVPQTFRELGPALSSVPAGGSCRNSSPGSRCIAKSMATNATSREVEAPARQAWSATSTSSSPSFWRRWRGRRSWGRLRHRGNARIESLEREDYDVGAIILNDTYDDLDQLAEFLDELREVRAEARRQAQGPASNSSRPTRCCSRPEGARSSPSSPTPPAISRPNSNDAACTASSASMAAAPSAQRGDVIRRFAPYYNGSSTPTLAERPAKSASSSPPMSSPKASTSRTPRASSITTCTGIPVRLMQRIGRVDRRMNSEIEAQHRRRPSRRRSELRASVDYWNFLPPDELNELLTLYSRVSPQDAPHFQNIRHRGPQAPPPEDDYEVTRNSTNNSTANDRRLREAPSWIQRSSSRHTRNSPPSCRRCPWKILRQGSPQAGRQGRFFCHRVPRADPDLSAGRGDSGEPRW